MQGVLKRKIKSKKQQNNPASCMQIHAHVCGAVNSQAESRHIHLLTETADRKSVREREEARA